jgi:hypothetical protein
LADPHDQRPEHEVHHAAADLFERFAHRRILSLSLWVARRVSLRRRAWRPTSGRKPTANGRHCSLGSTAATGKLEQPVGDTADSAECAKFDGQWRPFC